MHVCWVCFCFSACFHRFKIIIDLVMFPAINSYLFRYAWILCCVNGMTVIFAGIVIFSILGFMALDAGLEIAEVVTSGKSCDIRSMFFYFTIINLRNKIMICRKYPDVSFHLRFIWMFTYFKIDLLSCRFHNALANSRYIDSANILPFF